MRRACMGDAEAFGELAARHRSSALRVATVVLGGPQGADDVVQDATIRAWRAMPSVDPERRFCAWYLRVVANCARNDRRSRGRRAALAVRAGAEPVTPVLTPEQQLVSDTDRQLVVSALNHLAADDRLVIALRHFEQLSEMEMAEVMDCPAGTVKSRLSRAMLRLRRHLDGLVGERDA